MDSASASGEDKAPEKEEPAAVSAVIPATTTEPSTEAAAVVVPKEGEDALEEGEIPPSPTAVATASTAAKKPDDPRVIAELERQVSQRCTQTIDLPGTFLLAISTNRHVVQES